MATGKPKKANARSPSDVFLTSTTALHSKFPKGSGSVSPQPVLSSPMHKHERIKNINTLLDVIKEGNVGEDTLDWIQRLRKPQSVRLSTLYPFPGYDTTS